MLLFHAGRVKLREIHRRLLLGGLLVAKRDAALRGIKEELNG
jgi:hypothetical protein